VLLAEKPNGIATEEEWQTCPDPWLMLEILGDRVSERKLRLFAMACYRRVWHLLQDESEAIIRRAAGLLERYAYSGQAPPGWDAVTSSLGGHPILWAEGGYDLSDIARRRMTDIASLEFAVRSVGYACRNPVDAPLAADFAGYAETALSFLAQEPEQVRAQFSGNRARFGAAAAAAYAATFRYQLRENGGWRWVQVTEVEEVNGYGVLAALADTRLIQSALLRDVIGNPFRPVAVDPAWLAWHDGFIRALARRIDKRRAFDLLPILADALEDAGCDNADMVAHCRLGTEHVRGCWLVDSLLGME
jgi:hypothetical protein